MSVKLVTLYLNINTKNSFKNRVIFWGEGGSSKHHFGCLGRGGLLGAKKGSHNLLTLPYHLQCHTATDRWEFLPWSWVWRDSLYCRSFHACWKSLLGSEIIWQSFYSWGPPQPQLNLNSTQKLGLTRKWLWSTTHPPTTTHHQELNVSNISATTDPILAKLKR